MKKSVLTALFGLALTSTAGSEGKETKLADALAVEWVVANCDYPDSMGLVVMMAGMVINGSDPEKVKAERPRVHAMVKDRFASIEEACRSAMDHMVEQP